MIGADLFGTAAAATLKDCEDASRAGDSAAAIQCLQPLAQTGNSHAEMLLGVQYGVVNKPTYDAEKSAFWTKKAAEQGDVEAQLMAGFMYRKGEGVPRDLAESMKWFRNAADRGDEDAQFQLGVIYFKGWGTPKDVEQAISWLRKAADHGGPLALSAEEDIAGVYLKGDGVPPDYAEAVRWFRRAAEHESPTAYLTLAQLDEKGLGGPPDPVEAYVAYSIALAWLQDQHAPANVTGLVVKHRDGVAAKLTAAQKMKADFLVHESKNSIH